MQLPSSSSTLESSVEVASQWDSVQAVRDAENPLEPNDPADTSPAVATSDSDTHFAVKDPRRSSIQLATSKCDHLEGSYSQSPLDPAARQKKSPRIQTASRGSYPVLPVVDECGDGVSGDRCG